MIRFRLVASVLLLVLMASLEPFCPLAKPQAQDAGQAAAKPISIEGLLDALKIGGLTPAEYIKLVQQRGVDFQMTAAIEKQLQNAGVTPELLQCIRANYRPAASAQDILTNQAVIDMVAAGLPQDLILTKIRNSKTHFDLSASALIDLNKKGVSPEIVKAMINPAVPANAQPSVATSPTPAALPQNNPSPADQLATQCNGGNGGACAQLGSLYEHGSGVARNLLQASTLYGNACDRGNLDGCRDLALLYGFGRGVALDYPKAAALVTKGCSGGDSDSCSYLALMSANGMGVQKNVKGAFSTANSQCNSGHPVGCWVLGTLYLNGQGTAFNLARGVTLETAACSQGVPLACDLLAEMSATGRGLPKNPAQALQIYTNTCNSGDDTGCVGLATMYANGVGVAVDRARAASLYGRACTDGLNSACPMAQSLGQR